MERPSATAALAACGRRADRVPAALRPLVRLATFGGATFFGVRAGLVDREIGPVPQVVLLGAGWDDRAGRLAALAPARVFAVDRPATLAAASRRSAGAHPVPCDLRTGDLGAALAAAGHRAAEPTCWVAEGLVGYLDPASLDGVARVLGALSAPGSRAVFTCPSRGSWPQRAVARALGEPFGPPVGPEGVVEALSRAGFAAARSGTLAERAHAAGLGVTAGWALGLETLVVAERGP